jgi:urease gamma subunit
MSKSCQPFYLNIVLLNKDEVVASKVTEKAGNGFFGKAAAFAANKLVTDEKVVNQLTEQLVDGISKTIHELGIEATFELKYQQGPLVVIKISVVEIDTLQLILSTKGPEFASNFSSLLASVEKLGLTDSVMAKVDEKIHVSITDGMMSKFADMIPKKMQEKGVLVECLTATTDNEAEVFFNLL